MGTNLNRTESAEGQADHRTLWPLGDRGERQGVCARKLSGRGNTSPLILGSPSGLGRGGWAGCSVGAEPPGRGLENRSTRLGARNYD